MQRDRLLPSVAVRIRWCHYLEALYCCMYRWRLQVDVEHLAGSKSF